MLKNKQPTYPPAHRGEGSVVTIKLRRGRKTKMSTEAEKPAQSQSGTSEQGCGVDWSWLEGRTIAHATNDLQNMTIEFEDGLTFKIQALLYKGQSFLAFSPHKNPEAKD